IGSFGGSLSSVSATELGAQVIKRILDDSKITGDQVDEVILGNVLQAGLGQNPARQASIKAGLPDHVPALTINKVCGSGLKAIHLARRAITGGDAEVSVAGGIENMSQDPYLSMDARNGLSMGNNTLFDSMLQDGLWCGFHDYHMRITSENICDRYELTRE